MVSMPGSFSDDAPRKDIEGMNKSAASGLSPEDITPDDMVIAFMGPTGTGKSTFIDLLTNPEEKRGGDNLESVTRTVDAICVPHPKTGNRIVLVDTPGFDDTYLTELEILKLIADWLTKTYKQSVKLFGIIYLHSIADRRMKGSTMRNLTMFERLCGEFAMASVVFTTTMWEDVKTTTGVDREGQLKSKFWQPMVDAGATVDRLEVTESEEAWRVIDNLIDKRTGSKREAILLQVELVDLGKKLKETAAGKELHDVLKETMAREEKRRKELQAEKKGANNPTAVKEMDKELKEIEAKIEQISTDAAKLNISFTGRVRNLFSRN